MNSCDLHPAPDMPPVADGKGQVRRLALGWIDSFDEFVAEVSEYFDLDESHVGTAVRYLGKQRSSGLEVELKGVDVWEFRDGKLVRGTIGYANRDAALDSIAKSRGAAFGSDRQG